MGVIDNEIIRMRTAVHGEEMRDAIGDAMEILDRDCSDVIDSVEDLVIVSENEPTEEFNKIWVNPNVTEVRIPTYDEFEENNDTINESIENIETEVDDLKSALDEFDVLYSVPFTLSQGGINTADGGSQGSAAATYGMRVRTGYLSVNPNTGFRLTTPDGFLTQIYYYDGEDNNRYIGYDAFSAHEKIASPKGNVVRIVYAKANLTDTLTPSEIVSAEINGIKYTDDTLTLTGKAADAKIVGDKFKQYELISVNRFNNDDSNNLTGLTLNKNTGNTTAGSSFGTSDFIDVEDISLLTTSYCVVLCFYDAEKQFLIGYQYSNSASTDYVKNEPQGCKYARVSYKLADIDKVQVGYVLNRLDYIPYNAKFSFPTLRVDSSQVLAYQPLIVAPTNGNYTSLTRAIYENRDTECTIVVKPGTYDIVAEYVELFGQDVVDSLADSTDLLGFQYGIRIRYKKIIFEPGSHLVCDWTGHTVNGTHRFSVFSIAENVELEGLDLDCTGVFYAIHDDYGSVSVPIYKIYKNCRVTGHSIFNDNIIGGGCRPYARIIIDGCYFDNGGSDTSVCVRYHNSNVAGSEPVLWISNSYFAQRLSFRWYGTQTTKMRAYVNNCHANAIYKGAEGSSTNDNVEVIKWNNEEITPVA